MMHSTAASEQSAPKPALAWVRDVLEPDQISTVKPRLGRRRLSRTLVVILWGLRIYVLLMTLLIGLQIWNALHAAG